MTLNVFSKKAKTCDSSEPKKFIKWYKGKLEELKPRVKHLFDVRDTTVHKGGSWMDAKLKDSYTRTKEGVKAEKEIHLAGMPETVAVSECERIYHQMVEIVKEARKKF